MSADQLSMQRGYRLGRFIGVVFVGAVIYGLYGLVYWLVTGNLYFGPWEWGLCLTTAIYLALVQKADKKYKADIDSGELIMKNDISDWQRKGR